MAATLRIAGRLHPKTDPSQLASPPPPPPPGPLCRASSDSEAPRKLTVDSQSVTKAIKGFTPGTALDFVPCQHLWDVKKKISDLLHNFRGKADYIKVIKGSQVALLGRNVQAGSVFCLWPTMPIMRHVQCHSSLRKGGRGNPLLSI